jgi:hypothetical protein
MKFLGISAIGACFFFLLVFSTGWPGYAGDEAPVLFDDFADRPHNVADGKGNGLRKNFTGLLYENE